MAASERKRRESRYQSIFDLPPGFFDSSRLLRPLEIPSSISLRPPSAPRLPSPLYEAEALVEERVDDAFGAEGRGKDTATLWTCNTCKQGFESLQDQRSHFKSDLHRLNVKLCISGKNIIKEEDFDELGGDASFEDFDISSISDSEDESEKGLSTKGNEEIKQRLFLRLESGDTISVWRCLLMDESAHLSLDNSKSSQFGDAGCLPCMDEVDLINRLKLLVCEPRNKTHLRIVLLVSGGHFAGCVFDGNSIIAHKTFHRYVVRAKAGKKQSSKDATGKAAHSAGSALRRYNEAALKKDIQELLISWKQYIQSASCIFIYAPSKNRQLLFDDEKPHLNFHEHVVRHVPLTVHRPTLKEVKRVYNQLTQMGFEVNCDTSVEESEMNMAADQNDNLPSHESHLDKHLKVKETSSELSSAVDPSDLNLPSDAKSISFSPPENELTPLHEAARSGNAQQTLELLEQGLNPCIKDPRGRTPYMLATDKEVRNTFRRFMALNLDKWDWHAANVPSPLTKEMEETQAAKQAEKDAKRKAKAKELKKLRKAKEKAKAQAEAENTPIVSSQIQGTTTTLPTPSKPQTKPNIKPLISKEEEQKRALAEAREKRAAAAERRIAALNAQPVSTAPAPISYSAASSVSDIKCSCCDVSLAGKVPFHRYHYKYCSTSCMHVHREMLEDG